jgi:hypothetical protein
LSLAVSSLPDWELGVLAQATAKTSVLAATNALERRVIPFSSLHETGES